MIAALVPDAPRPPRGVRLRRLARQVERRYYELMLAIEYDADRFEVAVAGVALAEALGKWDEVKAGKPAACGPEAVELSRADVEARLDRLAGEARRRGAG